MTTTEIIVRATGEKKIAIYAPNEKGNKQYNVDGEFYTDKDFDSLFLIPIKVEDSETGLTETVVNRTANSYNVTQTKRTRKGINCTNWFEEKEFNKRFHPVS